MRDAEADYVKSPLLEAEPENYDLQELAGQIEEELRSLVEGEYTPSVTNENIQHYGFEDSTSNQNPDWWRPRVGTELAQEDPTVEEWMDTVVEQLRDNPNYTIATGGYEEDALTGQPTEVNVRVGDYQQINENVIVAAGDQKLNAESIEQASQILAEQVPEREYEGVQPTYTTEREGFNVKVEPDLSTGFFQASVQVGPDTHSSEVWMPAANSERAILVGTPSQFSPETESSVVSVPGESFTGDPLTDAVADSLSYFLPFEGVPQTEISSEAIDYRNENPLDEEPYSVRINSNAWDKFQDLDQEYRNRVQDKMDQVAMHPGQSPLTLRESGKVDQVGSNDVFVKWREHDQSRTVELKDIMDRGEAFPNKGDQNSRT